MLKVLDTSCLLRFSYVLLGQKQPLLFLYCLFVALQVFGSCPSNVTASLVNLLWCSPWTWHHKDYSGANSEMMQTDLAGLAGYCAVSQNPVLGAFFNALLLASWNRHHLELFLETAFLFCVQTVLGISCHTGQGMDWDLAEPHFLFLQREVLSRSRALQRDGVVLVIPAVHSSFVVQPSAVSLFRETKSFW